MKRISEIYTEYKIMPNLQEHMLRVTAVASLICDNFAEPIPKEEIVLACLLHDMGNIIKFQLDYFPEFNKPEGIEYWQKVQDEYIKKYGTDEVYATQVIAEELGFGHLLDFIEAFSYDHAFRVLKNDDLMIKICYYSDSRVAPFGVVSIQERLADGKKRYENRKYQITDEERLSIENSMTELEKQIFSKCKIKPEDINDETVAPVISKLRNFVIK